MKIKFTKTAHGYELADDTRFQIIRETRPGLLGVGPMVFGNYTYGDGSPVTTGWHITIPGSGKMFAPGKLAACKSKLSDPIFRAWALERAGLS